MLTLHKINVNFPAQIYTVVSIVLISKICILSTAEALSLAHPSL